MHVDEAIFVTVYIRTHNIHYYMNAGTENYLQPFDYNDVHFAKRFVESPGSPVSLEFLQAAEILMRENNLLFPSTVSEALDFYVHLRNLFDMI